MTSGGATTFIDLALYLVERYGGGERANAAARVLLIDGARTSQLPYVIAGAGHRDHDDAVVHRLQTAIEDGLARPLRIDELAGQAGLSPRTLTRRMRDATGLNPQSYVRVRRIDAARRLLEVTGDPIGNVRRQVGYRDPAAFRRAFRERTGLTPTGYRARYGWRPDQHGAPGPRHRDVTGRLGDRR